MEFFTLFLSLFAIVSSQHSDFFKYYGLDGYIDSGRGICQLPDESFFVLGETYNHGDHSSPEVLISHISPLGDYLWDVRSGRDDSSNRAYSINPTSDGGYLICGLHQIYFNDVFLSKYDEDVNEEFCKIMNTGGNDFGSFAHETRNGSYIFGGFSDHWPYYVGAFIGKLSNSLEKQWITSIGGQSKCSFFYGGVVDEDEYTYAVGNVGSPVMLNLKDVLVAKFFNNGSLVWAWLSDLGALGAVGRDIVLSRDGYLYITGYTGDSDSETFPFLLKLKNTTGELVWAKYINVEGRDWPGEANSVIETSLDGNIVIAGEIDNNVLLAKFEPDGNCLWVKSFKGGDEKDVAESVIETTEYNLAIIGSTSSFASERDTNEIFVTVTTPDELICKWTYHNSSKASSIFDFEELLRWSEWDNPPVFDRTSESVSDCAIVTGDKEVDDFDIMGYTCSFFLCYNFAENDSRECSGMGECLNGSCFCNFTQEGYYWGGQFCSEPFCFGVLESSDTFEVCSGHGYCVSPQNCSCFLDNEQIVYFGRNCSIYYCYGFLYNDTGNVCSGHGDCIDYNDCYCTNDYIHDSRKVDGFQNCSTWECYDIYHDEDDVCKGHGDCTEPGTCICDVHYNNISSECDWSCFGTDWREIGLVCSGEGECQSYDNCSCTSNKYIGERCHIFTCYGESSHDFGVVCGGHGICNSIDECICSNSNYGKHDCSSWYCFGTEKDVISSVCSQMGTCTDHNSCECDGEYHGDNCETWSCGLKTKDDADVCSGNGICDNPQICQCNTLFEGDECQTNLMLYIFLTPFASMAAISLLLCCCCLVCGSFCFLCWVCCCSIFALLSFLVCGGSGSGVFILRQRKSISQFNKLENFDLFLKEQELEKDSSVAHITIEKSLFSIDYEELEINRILGEGGSNSVVYQAVWRKQTVAFKCFKTRTLLSTQHSYDEFKREVDILASVSHPNIIRFYGATLKPPRVGIVMEFCENGDLQDFLSDKIGKNEHFQELDSEDSDSNNSEEEEQEIGDDKTPNILLFETHSYPLKEKLRMCLEICASMDYMHSRSIIHRDLKLENVLVDVNEKTKLMDFGLSRLLDRMSQMKTAKVGTCIFMAPEIVLTETYDQKVDVFSFSIMMYIIFSENFNPYGDDIVNVEIIVANNPSLRPNIGELERKLPRKHRNWISEAIQKCWNHNPKERYSFSQLSEIIDEKLNNWEGDEEEEEEEQVKEEEEKIVVLFNKNHQEEVIEERKKEEEEVVHDMIEDTSISSFRKLKLRLSEKESKIEELMKKIEMLESRLREDYKFDQTSDFVGEKKDEEEEEKIENIEDW